MSDINTSALDAEPRDAQNTDTKLLRNEELSAPATTAAGRCSVLPTLSAYVCMITYALCLSMIGPTIPNLEVLLDTDLRRLSWAQTVKCLGNVAGGVLVGLIFSRVNHELTFAVTSVVCCVSMCIAPVTGSVYGFICALGGLGLTGGVYNAGGNVYIISLWQGVKWKRPATLAFHAFFSIGMALGPLLTKPFLVPVSRPTSNSTDTAHNVTDDTWNLSSENRTLEGNQRDMTLVTFAYVTVGLLALLGGILFLCVHLKQRGALHKHSEGKTPPLRQGEDHGGSQQGSRRLFHILMLIGLFLSLCFAVITLHVPGSLLASFVVQELGWTVADGSFLTAVFYGSFCIGRLISLPLSLAVSPATLLLCGMCTAVSGYILMLVVCHLLPVYVYLSVAVVGLGQSSIIGSLYVWASNHMSLSGRDTGILQCGFSMGEMGAQPLTAYLFETYTPMWLIYVCIGASSLTLVVFASMQALVTWCCHERQTDRSLIV